MGGIHSVAVCDVGLIAHMVTTADALPPAPPAMRHMIDPACYNGTDQLLTCTGRVKAHNDRDFPRWASLLILRCGPHAMLKVGRDVAIALRPGIALTFDAHMRHSVDQALNDVLVWAPVADRDEPIHADSILELALARWPTPTTKPRSAE